MRTLRFGFPLQVGGTGWSFAVVAKTGLATMWGPPGAVEKVSEPEAFVEGKGLGEVMRRRPPELRASYPHITQFASRNFLRLPNWKHNSDQATCLLALLQKGPPLAPCDIDKDEVVMLSASVVFGARENFFHGATIGVVSDHGDEDNRAALSAKWRAVVESPLRYKMLMLSEEDARIFDELRIDPRARIVGLPKKTSIASLLKSADSGARGCRPTIVAIPPTNTGLLKLVRQCGGQAHHCEELPYERATISVSRAKLLGERIEGTQRIVILAAPPEFGDSSHQDVEPLAESDEDLASSDVHGAARTSTSTLGGDAPMTYPSRRDDRDADGTQDVGTQTEAKLRREFASRAPSRLSENQEPTDLVSDPRESMTQYALRDGPTSLQLAIPDIESQVVMGDWLVPAEVRPSPPAGMLSFIAEAEPDKREDRATSEDVDWRSLAFRALDRPAQSSVPSSRKRVLSAMTTASAPTHPLASVWIVMIVVGVSAFADRSTNETLWTSMGLVNRGRMVATDRGRDPLPGSMPPVLIVPPVHIPLANAVAKPPSLRVPGDRVRVACGDEYEDVKEVSASIYELSGSEYAECVRTGRCKYYADVIARPREPLRNIALTEAAEVCRALGLRLPTDLEWSLLAHTGPGALCNKALQRRGGGGTSCDLANLACDGNPMVWETTRRAAQESPDWLIGVYGNVSEWTAEGHVRGGNYDDTAERARPGIARSLTDLGASERSPRVGLRCVE